MDFLRSIARGKHPFYLPQMGLFLITSLTAIALDDDWRYSFILRTVLMFIIFYATVLHVIRRLFFSSQHATYSIRHRTRTQFACGVVLASIFWATFLAIAIRFLSIEDVAVNSAKWREIRIASHAAVDFSQNKLTSLYHHAAASAYTSLNAACRLPPGMTSAIEEPWDQISAVSPVLHLDRTAGNPKCWTPAPSRLPLSSTEPEENFRLKAISLAAHIRKYIVAIVDFERAIDNVVSSRILLVVSSLEQSITKILSSSTSPPIWSPRVFAFYSSISPPTISAWKYYPRLYIRSITYPLFTLILNPFFAVYSSPTLESLLYNFVQGSELFTSEFDAQRRPIYATITIATEARQHVFDELSNLQRSLSNPSDPEYSKDNSKNGKDTVADLESILSKHPDFSAAFKSIRTTIFGSLSNSNPSPFTSSSSSSSTPPSVETDQSSSLLLSSHSASPENFWWGESLERHIQTKVFRKIDQVGANLRVMMDQGSVVGRLEWEGWRKLGNAEGSKEEDKRVG